ncbi:TetR/AcrR family transcriptional regulator [Amycolatopsis sp. PS_44_ISF1]|uniref:TetR/AcrR family transcriptional regulator n=1 Tax=Amycolatopsis sp. PS_44_ISF1 TaxID=2974917 RepID=UPI0028E04FFD|nr:TetR/AcrR family transcriptional regulator [Amycolatopsis sp. PS_44_ISF1]MDT8909546.1 TetR/AcrR family transcriptional regulator [Amycolatopsis sp. PS_44_ISF1]
MTTRAPRRRTETRRRLLDAALEVFAEEGFGRSTVEQVCERAGYTRGAFYSNFASLDELFLAMWEQRSAAMIDALRAAFEEAGTDEVADVRAAVELLLPAIPVDEAWYRVSAEFTAHALRNPSLKRMVTDREDTIVEALMPCLEGLLSRAGRTVPDRAALGQALIAVHDGTTGQCLLEPDDPVVWRRRTELAVHVVTAYTRSVQ